MKAMDLEPIISANHRAPITIVPLIIRLLRTCSGDMTLKFIIFVYFDIKCHLIELYVKWHIDQINSVWLIRGFVEKK